MKKRDERQRVPGTEAACRLAQQPFRDRAEARRTRRQRQCEHRDRQRRLRERGDRHLAARSHAAERRAGVERAERQRDRAQHQQRGQHEQVANADRRAAWPRRRAPASRPSASWRRPRTARRERSMRRCSAITMPLASVFHSSAIRLQRTRATATLQSGLQPADVPDHRRRNEHQQQRLRFQRSAASIIGRSSWTGAGAASSAPGRQAR